ncbi:uncharacterized protein LOC121875105 isoform X2 [Homarus americanus]|uniref:C2H2-type domain-containing protein n=1 Tax=Homarus americanus TaxID=6706 RepID=A0A8J5JP14_HOMAM|nr:uncharacterized protein LOC121875105 isoform X2 [Homarus americanus]XP_042235399.1 uncharacterized protein LOC121875105 isoform X2 [Homarus americanus]KAG7161326.1 hypothetical protein Hamer_G013955 [Homarus americanus]
MMLLDLITPRFLQDYDKAFPDGRGRDATKKLLLSPSAHTGERKGTNGTKAMFQPPATDIYLCDKCENEFYSLREVQTHEKQCRGDVPSSPAVPSPEPDLIDDEPEPAGQVPFLSYFNLQPAKHTGVEPYMSPRKRSTSSPPRKIPGPMYPRYDSIAISSPLGRFLFANSKFRNKYQASQHYVMRYERHLHATRHTDVNSGRERCNNRWIVVWRDRKEEQPWVHLYCFTSGQRQERRITINTGLNRGSRRLMRLCRPVKIVLKRLKKSPDNRLKQVEESTAPCIDLTVENQMDHRWTLDGYSNLPVNNRLPDSRAQLYTNESYEASSSGRAVGTTQWLHGIQPLCGPGGSGILSPGGMFNSSLTPKHIDQLGIHELNPNATFQQNSLKMIPLPSPRNQPLLTSEQIILQSILSQKAQMQKVASNNVMSQSLIYPVEGTGVPMKLKDSSPADISIIPLNSIALHNSSNKQLNSDKLKPLSRRKYGICDQQSSVQGFTVSEQSSNNSRVGVPVPNEALLRSPGYHRGQNKQITSTHSESLPKGNQNIYSHIVPDVSERNSNSVPINNTNVSLSNVSHTKTISCIEIIDLSSDDDDVVRARGQSEADNAPQQLDGLACYPHTGAKVPDSSDYSLPKNGNSHWSSKQKSHCGAGRVGDLATNGQPPNVPPNIATLPVPHVLFLPNNTVSPSASQGPETKGNSRKRKSQEPQCGGGKTLILDISNTRVNVSSNGSVRHVPLPSRGCTRISPEEDDQVVVIPKEIIPVTQEELSTAHVNAVPLTEANFHRVSNQNGAFGNKKYAHENSKMFRVDKDISFKSPFHIAEDNSFNIISIKERQMKCKKTEETMTPEKGMMINPNKHFPVIGTPVGGLINSIVNTVSKGVEFFKSLVGTEGNGDCRHYSNGKISESENSLLKLHREQSILGKSVKKKDNDRLEAEGVTFSACLFREKRSPLEVRKLLHDECRELKCKGLGELRQLDLQDTRLTRRSVERYTPSRARRKNICVLENREDLNPLSKYEIKPVNMSKMSATDSCNLGTIPESNKVTTANIHHLGPSSISREGTSGCTDENGNSASYMKLGVESNDNCPIGTVTRELKFEEFSENKKIYSGTKASECILHGKERSQSNDGRTLVETYNSKPVKKLVPSVSFLRSKVVFYKKSSITAGGLKNISRGGRKRFSISKRELLNLATDEWKEMRKRGFHPVKNMRPVLNKVIHTENHIPQTDRLSTSVATLLNMYGVEEPKKKYKKMSKEKKVSKEIRALVQDEWKEMSRMGFRLSELPEIRRAMLRSTQYDKVNSPKGDEVGVSPTVHSDARLEFMGKTAEECGALQAQTPNPEDPRKDKHFIEIGKIITSDSGTSESLVLNTVKTCTGESNVTIKDGVVSEIPSESVARTGAGSKKKRYPSLIRELCNLGRDEYKELRGTGFHPADLVGSEKVKYLNASSDEEDDPSYFSKTESPIEKHEPYMREREKKKVSLKISRELSGLLSDECKELKDLRGSLKKFKSYNSKQRVKGEARTQTGYRKLRAIRSVLPTTSLHTSSAVISESGVAGNSTKKRMWCQTRSTRSQVNHVLSNIEVFTPRSSHRQILRSETAMCVLNYHIPNIN